MGKSINIRVALALLLALFVNCSGQTSFIPDAEGLIAQQLIHTSGPVQGVDLEFKISVVGGRLPGGDTVNWVPARRLTVTCTKGCDTREAYSEISDDYPIGIFYSDLAHAELITLWEGATSYRVATYHIDGNEVRKVFDAKSKSFPTFALSGDGRLVVSIGSNEKGAGIEMRNVIIP